MVEEPRKPYKSTFWIWLIEKRKTLGRELAQQVQVQDRLSSWVYVASADITKLGRQKWKALPDAAKKIYSAKADELKEEYHEKMAAFLGAGGVVKGVRDGPEGGAGSFGTAEEAAELLCGLAGSQTLSASPSCPSSCGRERCLDPARLR